MPRRLRFKLDHVAEALRQTAGIRSMAAQKLGCAPTTVTNYIERYPKLQRIVDELVEESLDLAEGQLLKAIGDGNMTAVIFYLKTKGKHRGYVERSEVSGKEGGPIAFTDLASFLAQGFAGAGAGGSPEVAGPSDLRVGRVPPEPLGPTG